tara:strand:+ start:41884 stop:42156 length:273 start_codon:yes stop_codon:yes gene_type:complete
MTKTKKDIVNTISQIEGIDKNISYKIVNSFFDIFSNESYEQIKLHKFGTFKRKKTSKRYGRNPQTGEIFDIKPFAKIVFKPSNSVKNRIN